MDGRKQSQPREHVERHYRGSIQCFAYGVERLTASIHANQAIHPLLARAAAEQDAEVLIDRFTGQGRRELLIQQILAANSLTKDGPELGFQGREGHVLAILGLVDVVADHAPIHLASAPGYWMPTLVIGYGERQEGQGSTEQRSIHPLSLPRAFPIQEGKEDAHSGPHGAGEVGHRHAGHRGWPVARPGQVEQAGQALVVQVVTRPHPVGPGRPVSTEGAVDKPGIGPGQLVVSQAQAFHHAGAKALQEYVGGTDESQQDGPPLVRFEIQCEA